MSDPTSPSPTPRNQVFVSYSHADEEYLKRLRTHLRLLERRNIKVWTDKDIEPGMVWHDEIRNALSRAKVAVLLISTDFLNSDFITKQELPPLLEAAEKEGLRVLPVLVKESVFGDLELEPLSRYQAVNMGRPLAMVKDEAERDGEFVKILQSIRKQMEGAPSPSSRAADATRGTAPAPTTGRTPATPSAAPRPANCPAAPSPVGADETANDEAEDDEEEMTLDEALYEDLEAMAADPGRQSLSIQAVTDHGAVELMLVTEGRDSSVLVELLTNDELPAEFHFDREAQRHVVEELGFNPPEQRGDRFWTTYGGEDGDTDNDGLTQDILAVLEEVFGLPDENTDVSWQILEC